MKKEIASKDTIVSSLDVNSPAYIKPDSDLRALCGFFGGVFYCVKGKLIEPSVQSYAQLLINHGAIHDPFTEVSFITFDELANFYCESTDSSNSAMQDEMIGVITKAVKKNASDIHVQISKKSSMAIKFRIHGDLELEDGNRSGAFGLDLVGSCYNTMVDCGDPVFSEIKSIDGRMKDEFAAECKIFGARYSQRVKDDGLLVVLRLLYDRGFENANFQSLGYADEQIKILERLMKRNGMVVVSGATGSGKSTTIATILSMIIEQTKGKKHVITVEDPPEYKIKGAMQTTLSYNFGRYSEEAVSKAWAEAISSILRLDPDVVMIGEVRDKESAKGAIHAAQTGHQVWTTLHVTTALGVIERLSGMGCDKELISDPSIISGLINQSLTKRLCDSCKKPLKGNESLIDDLDALARVRKYTDYDNVFIKGDGCSVCENRGFTGRVAIAEVIATDGALMKVMTEKGKIEAFKFWRDKQGGLSKCMLMTRKINEGILDPFIVEDDIHLSLDYDDVFTGDLS